MFGGRYVVVDALDERAVRSMRNTLCSVCCDGFFAIRERSVICAEFGA